MKRKSLSMVHYFIDTPKLGIYFYAMKGNTLGGFFTFHLGFGTYNSINIEILGRYLQFTVAVGNWHSKYKNNKDDV